MPTPPTPSSSAGSSRRPSARTTRRRSASASQLIAEAAQHQPADGNALGALNQSLVAYTSQVEQARANNRQALPVGAQYLRGASADLRSDALPLLTNLGEANTDRVSRGVRPSRHGRPCGSSSPGLLTLSVLGLALVWLARRTRRYVNLPLAAARAGGARDPGGRHGRAAGGQGGRRHHPRRRLRRHAVHGARPASPGSTPSPTRASPSSPAGRASRSRRPGRPRTRPSPCELTELGQNPASSGLDPLPWSDYVAVHTQIRALDESGKWDEAVALATGNGSGNATFAAFDTSSDAQLASLNEQTAQQLDQGLGWLPVSGALGVLAGVVAAACAWWGMSLRLEEYR